jgi:hypothetical protein
VEGGFVNSEGLSMSLTARLTADQQHHFHVRQQSSSIISMYASRAEASFPCTPAEQQQQQQHTAGEQESSSISDHQHLVVDSEIPTKSKMKQESSTHSSSSR